MLNESASSVNGHQRPSSETGLTAQSDEASYDHPLYSLVRGTIAQVFHITEEQLIPDNDIRLRLKENILLLPAESKMWLAFRGKLRINSDLAYEQLDAEFTPHDLVPVFRTTSDPDAPHVIYVVQGRVKPREGGNALALVLFALTVLSVLYVGTVMAIGSMENPIEYLSASNNIFGNLWRGIPYAASILLILGMHELGHYFLARFHRTASSLPYFVPFPFGIFGTFGAAIRLREPMRNRRVLLDIGAAGPLAGLLFAIPILFIGLATSEVDVVRSGLVEGNSLFYAFAKLLVFGRVLPADGVDVYVNQLAWAGWTGLLVTGLNLIPVGQLDGGHILYSVLGVRARHLFWPIIGGLFLLTIFVSNELLVFVALILLMGNRSATPLDDITPLDPRRRMIAAFALVIFVLVFVPSPLTQVTAETPRALDGFISHPTTILAVWLAWGYRRFRR